MVLPLSLCGKPKIGSDSVVKKRTAQKFDIHSDDFLTETARTTQSKVKVTKITLLIIIIKQENNEWRIVKD